MKKIFEIYRKLSLPAKASLWYVVCSVFQKGISVITTPVFTRLLTTEQYGMVSIYTSWETIITVFATLNFTAGVYNNAMVKYSEDRDGYTSVMQTWTTVISLLLVCVYFIGRTFWNGIFGLSTWMMVMMFLDIIFTAGMSFWTIRNRYEYRYIPVCIVTLLATILVPVVSVVFVLSTDIHKSEAKISGTVLVHVLIYGFIYFINIKNGKKIIDKDYVVYSTKFNIPLIPHYLSQNVLNQADRIMIDSMCSKAKAGIYSLAYNAGFIINIVTLSISSSFVPYLYENLKKKKYKEIGTVAVKIEVLVGSICFLFSLFAPEILKILATEEYYEAIWIIPPVAMCSLLNMMYSFFTNVEFYFEKNKFIMMASVLTAGLNVVLNYVFINLYGYLAAGYTTLLCWFVYSLAQYIFMVRVCREKGAPNPYNGRLLWGIAIAFITLSLLGQILFLFPAVRYIVMATVIIVCIVVAIIKRDFIMGIIKR